MGRDNGRNGVAPALGVRHFIKINKHFKLHSIIIVIIVKHWDDGATVPHTPVHPLWLLSILNIAHSWQYCPRRVHLHPTQNVRRICVQLSVVRCHSRDFVAALLRVNVSNLRFALIWFKDNILDNINASACTLIIRRGILNATVCMKMPETRSCDRAHTLIVAAMCQSTSHKFHSENKTSRNPWSKTWSYGGIKWN